MSKPTISVIMPVFNASKFLAESIESILNQTFNDFELIILNDKSTDNSLDIIKEFIQKDNRIVLINKISNVGPANLRNEGFDLAKGDFIALMDADDISESTRFEKQLSILNKNSDIGVCGTWFTLFGDKIKSRVINHAEFHDEIEVNFLQDCNIGNPTVMLRKDVLANLRFDNYFVPIEDYDLWSRLLVKTKFYNIQESLLQYRWHNTNISHTKKENLELKHNQVRKKLITKLGQFDDDEINEYLKVFKFEKKLNFKSLITKLNYGKKIIHLNEDMKLYNSSIFSKKINSIAMRSIEKAEFFNINFLIYIFKNEFELFKKMNFSAQLKIIFKSVLKFKQF